jgi:hypothetical protein
MIHQGSLLIKSVKKVDAQCQKPVREALTERWSYYTMELKEASHPTDPRKRVDWFG